MHYNFSVGNGQTYSAEAVCFYFPLYYSFLDRMDKPNYQKLDHWTIQESSNKLGYQSSHISRTLVH